jgi:DNA-binding transcriptional MocR family regulator
MNVPSTTSLSSDAAAPTTSGSGSPAQDAYDAYLDRRLALNMQRGQPSTADFDLSNAMLQIVGPEDVMTKDGLDARNYSVGAEGLTEARELFADYLGVTAPQVLVWNNASLELQAHVLTRMLLKGPRGGNPWVGGRPTMIVATPGYDRHFTLLAELGFRLATVDMQPDGPDLDAVEALVADDPTVRGILFVPTYSNPGGETISPAKATRLASIAAGAADFTIFADDAYRAHHLSATERDRPVDFLELVSAAGNPDRAFAFASTSKITFAGAGLGFVASSAANIKDLAGYIGKFSIGPNKIEQLRHVKFLTGYPGGIEGLMSAHAALIAPKFAAVDEVLTAELGSSGLATWTTPKGGYFISLDTTLPIADRVVALAKAAGVSLTPAGAAFPEGNDPGNTNIRLAPTRPELDDVVLAMRVVATCIRLASEQYQP